jgi:hypothetical protein
MSVYNAEQRKLLIGINTCSDWIALDAFVLCENLG